MTAKPKIGHKGIGWVGQQVMNYLLERHGYKVGEDYFPYDIDKGKEMNHDFNKGDWIIITVPSPMKEGGSCDTSIVEDSIKDIADGKVVIIKSTVAPGTCERIQQEHPNKIILFNPEFLTESQAKADFFYPDQQIVGHTKKSKATASLVLSLMPDAFFTSPGMQDCYIRDSINVTEAELGKYACNIFGSIKVSFANIFADVCEALSGSFKQEGVNSTVKYDNVRLVMGHDKRIKDSWLDISRGNYRGFGGYCFPKDLLAFIKFMEHLTTTLKVGADPKLISCLEKGVSLFRAVWEYNLALLDRQNLKIEDVAQHIDRVTATINQ
jgi:UDPglucose 6-dehydrogenase